jgi:hypothetical protein
MDNTVIVIKNERIFIMNKILNNLKNEMKSAQNNIYAIANSIPTTDATKQYDAMKKISAINHAYLILDSETSNTKTTRSPRPKNKTAIINGTEHNVSSVKDAVNIACKSMLKNNYKTIKANNDKFTSSVTGNHFASINKNDIVCENPVEVRMGNKTLYYDEQKMTTNNLMLFKKMLNTVNLPNNYLEMQKVETNTAE